MAESVVSFLLENLSQLLADEANLLGGVADEVTSLRNELRMIDAFLRYAERKKISNEVLDEVVDQIKDVANESEDVIDTFIAYVTKQRRRRPLVRTIHVPRHTMMLHEVARKIEKLKNRTNEIYSNKIKYHIEESESTSTGEDTQRWEIINRRRRNVEEDDVVGFFHGSSVVIQRLTEGSSHPRLTVVSIVGMGGLGKTTLARKIYNNNQVKNYFDCWAWVYVSNDCRPRELLLTLLKCFTSISQYVYNLSEDELKNKVRECLNGKRYFVVLDDIWKTQDWDSIKGVFPDDGIGSRILITSRLKDVASYTGCTQPYHLPFLSAEESWELFRKKVFRGEDSPSDLEPLGRNIAKNCRGLPLSIVVLSGLLANKEKSQREWEKIMGHVNWYLIQDETQVKDIVLKLSYDSLPRRLKPCFLYFGVFPRDFEVYVQPLIQKWIAEGFIQQYGTRNPEDVAEDYLYELVDRCLIQVASRGSDGGVKTCQIHDLLRDLCLLEAKKGKFFEVCTDTNILTQRMMTKPRRLSFHCSLPSYDSSRKFDHSGTRSVLCFNEKHYVFTTKHWKCLWKDFKLTRVLDIGQVMDFRTLSFPKKLKDLIHLRYLRIKNHAADVSIVIPDAICNLWNLETLDLGSHFHMFPRSFVFPSGMWKLKRLRHIRTPVPMILSDFSGSDTRIMWNIQTLSCVTLNEEAISLIQKGMFPNIRKLGLFIQSVNNEQWQQLWQDLNQLIHLNILKLFLKFQPPVGEVGEVESGTFPIHITKLTLINAKGLNTNMMTNLANFHNLRILKLCGFSYGDPFDLECFTGWFPQLQVFQMRWLKIQNWKLTNGAMPCLQRLVINGCSDLHNLPNELWSLTTLRQVQVLRPSKELAEMLQNLEMKEGVELVVQQ